VCKLLEKGQAVRALRREKADMREFESVFAKYFSNSDEQQKAELKQNLFWFISDVLDTTTLENALEGVDEIYHCAAIVSFLQKDREQMMNINVNGTANMVNIALQKGAKKFCHVSSIAALGREKSGDKITEKTKWGESKNNSNYAVSKYRSEMEVWRGIEEGLNAVIVNPGVILGAGNWNKGSCKLFKLVWKGMPFYTTGVNGYVDVKDVARAMISLMDNNISGERFILAGENMEMRNYLDMVAGQFNKKKPFIEAGKFLSQIAVVADSFKSVFTGREPSLTKETARSVQNRFYYSSKKINEKINFEFSPINETITEICNHFLNDHK